MDPVYSVLSLSLITKHRWKSITLESDNKSILSIPKELELSNLEILESFSLATRFYEHHSTSPRLSDALRYAPKLKTLSLCAEYHVAFDTLPFPWRQITCLTITLYDQSNNTADILRACVNLEEFIIDGNCDGSVGSEPITLNHLRKLHTHCIHNTFLSSLKTPSIQDFAVKASEIKYLPFAGGDAVYNYIKKNGSTLLKLSIAPVPHDGFVQIIPYLRSLVELKLYDSDYDNDGSIKIHKILRSLVVKPEMDPSTIPLPRLEGLEILCQAIEKNQRTFMEVLESRWWSDEEENARQKQGQRSLSRIKRSVLLNVHTELNNFCRVKADALRTEGMNIEYLAPFDGMDEDDFYTTSYYNYYTQ